MYTFNISIAKFGSSMYYKVIRILICIREYMIVILGKKFMTDKEAADRYGYSQAWFLKARYEKRPPKYIQVQEGGRVLYPLEETDEWFKKRMEMKE